MYAPRWISVLLVTLTAQSAQSPAQTATLTGATIPGDPVRHLAPETTPPPQVPSQARLQERQNGPAFVGWGFINGAWMPQSCSPGLSYMTVANYACCAANRFCVYFTTCAAGTVYGLATAVDCAAAFGGHCYTMYIVAEGARQTATAYDCHTALDSATLYRNTADAQALAGSTTTTPSPGIATTTTITGGGSPPPSTNSGDGLSSEAKIGLGVGLGTGIPTIIIALLAWCRPRQPKPRQSERWGQFLYPQRGYV